VTAAAQRLGVESAVMTFEPHPREYFAHLSGHEALAPHRVANLRDKLQALEAAGIDRVIVEHFNARFAAMSPEDFVRKLLIVGDDFRFGAKRAGDFAMLTEAGKAYGFEVQSLQTVTHAEARISSSAVRSALRDGDFSRAGELLGHPYSISGHVQHGRKLGRTIGFPTLNLRIAHKRPALTGIFIVRVHGLAPKALPAVASLGVRPTVEDNGRVLLEVHVFDYSADCYGKLIRVEFLRKLRDEEKYDDLDSLTAAITNDARSAREFFEIPTLS
jgi:riboflavin kinase/FMN adenylyltransferase